MLITVLDTETAREEGGVVEIAGVRVSTEQRQIAEWHHALTHPGFEFLPMDAVCRATHHIRDSEVETADLLSEVLGSESMYDPTNVLAAHNAPFDAGVMPEEYWMRNGMTFPEKTHAGGATWIDTLRCARHIWPDAPRYSNQVLRYWLGLDVSDMPEEAGGIVHRALYDTWATAKLLIRMLETHAPEELIGLSGAPVLLQGAMRFGKHRGTTWETVARTDRGYLRWIVDKSDMDEDTKHTARHWLG